MNKLKKKAKKVHIEDLRVEVRKELHDSVDEVENYLGPMDNFANIKNPEKVVEAGKGKNVDLKNIVRKERILAVHKFISRWAYESAIPFHAFERDSFKMMLENKKIVEKKKEQEWKEDGCSIMTDAWSNRKRRSIMNLCVNSKMERSSEAYTSQHIYEYVESCIQQVGPENVVQVVTDNVTNNMGATKLLKEKRPSIFWTSCATHTINLMFEGIGALPRFKKILDQEKKLTIFIYAHHKTLAMMKSYTNKKEIIRTGFVRKKEQLRHMFSSNEYEECKFFDNPKGIASYKTVTIFRMVDAHWKPTMGFVYGEIKVAKEEIIKSLGGNEKHYKPIIDIINTKMKGLEMQRQVTTIDFPKHKKKYDRFVSDIAVKHCKVNDAEFDPANWWGLFGGTTPRLTKITMMILSLTSSSSGCERNWSTHEGVHTKKRNRLEASKLNNLVYKHGSAIIKSFSLSAQEWIVDCDDCDVDEVDPKTVDEALATAVSQAPRESQKTRELFVENFESKSEEQVLEQDEYESDGVQIMEVCGED
uniref:DUF659 domain-containing protein n=1 Tax=Lactuca sativa TaxID=4236 RepID=A0A9R1VYQ6_LACSA|nr:hypothetical protein LSAT_V11C400196660 [Lactuca sativa]